MDKEKWIEDTLYYERKETLENTMYNVIAFRRCGQLVGGDRVWWTWWTPFGGRRLMNTIQRTLSSKQCPVNTFK